MEQAIVMNGTNPSPIEAQPKKRGRKPGSKNKAKTGAFIPFVGVASAGGGEAARKQATKAKAKGKPGPKPKAQPSPSAKAPASSFVPAEGLAAALAVLANAEAKYKNKPWQSRGESAEQHSLKAIGHLVAWLTGKKTDAESGQSSLAHAAARLLIALALK